MTFRLANKSKVFITTESSTSAVSLSGTVARVADSGLSSGDGINSGTYIRALGDVTATTNTDSLVPNCIGIDYPDDPLVTEDINIFNGYDAPTTVDIGIESTITLLVLQAGEVWSKVYDKAPFGINADDDDLFDGTSSVADNSNVGYRIYVYDGSSWTVFYHCRLMPDSYSKDVSDKNSTVRETVEFTYQDLEYNVTLTAIDDARDLV